jgi:hypothetical protein
MRAHGEPEMTAGVDRDRRRLLGRVAMAIGAAKVGMFGTAESNSASRQAGAIGRASEWLNSPRLAPDSLAGKVVLVQFWTYTCINWLRTLPYVRAWANQLIRQPTPIVDRQFEIEFRDAGVETFAFTFGRGFAVSTIRVGGSSRAIWTRMRGR